MFSAEAGLRDTCSARLDSCHSKSTQSSKHVTQPSGLGTLKAISGKKRIRRRPTTIHPVSAEADASRMQEAAWEGSREQTRTFPVGRTRVELSTEVCRSSKSVLALRISLLLSMQPHVKRQRPLADPGSVQDGPTWSWLQGLRQGCSTSTLDKINTSRDQDSSIPPGEYQMKSLFVLSLISFASAFCVSGRPKQPLVANERTNTFFGH